MRLIRLTVTDVDTKLFHDMAITEAALNHSKFSKGEFIEALYEDCNRMLDELIAKLADRKKNVDYCPNCGSAEWDRRHRDATFALPETDFKQCNACDQQWDHQ